MMATILLRCISFIYFVLFFYILPSYSTEKCTIDNTATDAIKNITSSDTSIRNSAAQWLIQNPQSSIPAIIKRLERLPTTPPTTWVPTDQQNAILLTDITRNILANNADAITRFRYCDSETVVQVLAWAARGDNKELRLNAANILANTVDNTTVCIVLHHLKDDKITVVGRANLLGITRAVASYAYKENAQAIIETIKALQDRLGPSGGPTQTQSLLVDTLNRAENSRNANTPIPEDSTQYCKHYNYTASLR